MGRTDGAYQAGLPKGQPVPVGSKVWGKPLEEEQKRRQPGRPSRPGRVTQNDDELHAGTKSDLKKLFKSQLNGLTDILETQQKLLGSSREAS